MQFSELSRTFTSDSNVINLFDCRGIDGVRIAIEFPDNVEHRLQHPQILL